MCGIINLNENRTEITYVFSLEEGTEYSIYVNNPTNNHVGTYEIHVSEDNWVYAPNGGLWTVVDYSTPLAITTSTTEQIYITPQLLADATINDSNEYSYYECHSMEDVEKIMAIITYDDPTKTTIFDDIGPAFFTVGGVLLVVISHCHPLAEIVFVAKCIKYGGEISTLTGGLYWLLDIFEKSESASFKNIISKGNLSISCGIIPSNSPFSAWYTWDSVPYINKYNQNNRGKIAEIESTIVRSWLPFNS